ncbi:phosphoribosylglycinamide formyltransferase [Salinispirillum marinum]|uniref:Phosphoribosylglycinamide formyltransferase n=2 Tax=Saccharospirillaceae TaxID=255527 RepID=A0ABV8BEY3_9GAMM
MSCRIVVLISGSGTNLQALIDAARNHDLNDAQLVGVISNRPNVGGLKRAEQAGIPSVTLNHQDFPSREAFDSALLEQIEQWRPDLVVLAGFMRILTPEFVQHFAGRMINIHPSLLPKYPGLHTHERAIAAGDAQHGASIHFVTADLDGGPIIVQAAVDVLPDDTPTTLAQRVQAQEHCIYPAVVRWFSAQRLTMRAGAAYMDGKPLGQTGLNWHDPETPH